MAEEEVIDVLRKAFKKLKKEIGGGLVCFSTREISEILKDTVNRKNIERALSQLRKYKEVEYIEIDVTLARKIYGKKMKRGLPLYFVIEE